MVMLINTISNWKVISIGVIAEMLIGELIK